MAYCYCIVIFLRLQTMPLKLTLTLLLLAFSTILIAQPGKRIPLMRMIFHEDIMRNQERLDQLDGSLDHKFTLQNPSATAAATAYLFDTITLFRENVEKDSLLDINGKIKYLRGLNEVLTSFYFASGKSDGIGVDKLPAVINLFKHAVQLERAGASIEELAHVARPEVMSVLLDAAIFLRNAGYEESRRIVFTRKLVKSPLEILPALRQDPSSSAADSLIKLVAYLDPESVYSYAQVNDALSVRIQGSTDPLVQTIYKLAQMNTGRLYFPFLDNLYRNNVTMQQVEESMTDKYKYFRLLVNTDIDYAGRFNKGDTPVEMSALSRMIKSKAIDGFINVINGLHDAPDNIRMREVEPLNAQELYFLCVMGDPEIYTSSYLKVYSRMFQKLKVPRGDLTVYGKLRLL